MKIHISKIDSRYIFQSGGVGACHKGKDKNNCAVRSIANALDWTIEQGTEYMKQFGRQTNRGTSIEVFLKAYKLAKFDQIHVFGSSKGAKYVSNLTNVPRNDGTTLGNLLCYSKFKHGTHIVVTTNHAVCIKDGVPIDMEGSIINKNSRVLMTFSKE